ncbi:MAG: citrate/2-methylcitrate synthase, partial [Ilumatobacteraceae bacterium]
MTMQMIEVPAGLNGVVAAETAIGAVNGDEGYFHYGAHDATRLARENTLEEVWFLVREGRLPARTELTRFRADVAALRSVPDALLPIVDVAAHTAAPPLAQLRSVLSVAAPILGLDPVIDIGHEARREQALRVAAMTPSILAALHRVRDGHDPVEPDATLGHAASYLYETTGT